jgi:hypothetical protein
MRASKANGAGGAKATANAVTVSARADGANDATGARRDATDARGPGASRTTVAAGWRSVAFALSALFAFAGATGCTSKMSPADRGGSEVAATPPTGAGGKVIEVEPSPPPTEEFGTSAPSRDARDAPAETAPRSAAAPKGGAWNPEPEAPRQRPGLGTEWGETVGSRVDMVSFVRATPDAPLDVATIHYNDRAGVENQARLAAVRPSRFESELPMPGGWVSVAVVDESDRPFETMRVRDRTYVVGESGERYQIIVRNRTGHRFEVVTTVDGVDVVSGRDGSVKARGYVLSPFGQVRIEGFRQSTRAVAAFRFASVGESYAARTGRARNVGVIGVALFSERGDEPRPFDGNDAWLRESASPFPRDGRFARPPGR